MVVDLAPRRSHRFARASATRPTARVAMVGAGRMARLTHQAAIALGVELRVLASGPDDAAARAVARTVVGSARRLDDLRRLVDDVDVLTFEHGRVDPEHLEALERDGVVVRPGPGAALLGEDRYATRRHLDALGFHVAPASAAGEAELPIDAELSVLVARSATGDCLAYPAVQTVRRGGRMVREILAPAPVDDRRAEDAVAVARAVVEATDVVGVVAVELYDTPRGIVVDGLAPRPHDAGHHTIEGAATSQFEQPLRAILGWPLGPTMLLAPAVVTVNVLGPADGSDAAERVPAALAVFGARVHLYGREARPGRRLGHVTACGPDLLSARMAARRATAILEGHA